MLLIQNSKKPYDNYWCQALLVQEEGGKPEEFDIFSIKAALLVQGEGGKPE